MAFKMVSTLDALLNGSSWPAGQEVLRDSWWSRKWGSWNIFSRFMQDTEIGSCLMDGPLDSLADLISPVQRKNPRPTTFPCISVTDCNCWFFFVLLFPFQNNRWKTLESFWNSVTLWECLKVICSRLLTYMKTRTYLWLVGTVQCNLTPLLNIFNTIRLGSSSQRAFEN